MVFATTGSTTAGRSILVGRSTSAIQTPSHLVERRFEDFSEVDSEDISGSSGDSGDQFNFIVSEPEIPNMLLNQLSYVPHNIKNNIREEDHHDDQFIFDVPRTVNQIQNNSDQLLYVNSPKSDDMFDIRRRRSNIYSNESNQLLKFNMINDDIFYINNKRSKSNINADKLPSIQKLQSCEKIDSSILKSTNRNFISALESCSSYDEDDDTIFAVMKQGSLHFCTNNRTKRRNSGIHDLKFNTDDHLGLNSSSGGDDTHNHDMDVLWKFTYGNIEIEEPRYRMMTEKEFSERRLIMEGIYTSDMIHKTEDVPLHLRTTVMLRNLPNKFSKENVLNLLHTYEYGDHFDFFYMPIDFRSKSNMGYCFINFVNPEDASQFKKVFTGFNDWTVNSTKKCSVDWSEPYQGLPAHIDRYRNSPVMHESVADEYKPCLYRNGEPVPFAKPLRDIISPKVRRGKRAQKKGSKNAMPV